MLLLACHFVELAIVVKVLGWSRGAWMVTSETRVAPAVRKFLDCLLVLIVGRLLLVGFRQ